MYEVKASMAGSIWQINVKQGDTVEQNEDVVILESMKMEIPLASEKSGVVKEILKNEGDFVNDGDVIIVIE